MSRQQYQRCVLTGFSDPGVNFAVSNGPVIEYTFFPVGKVKIAHTTYLEFVNKKLFKNPVLAGICRNAYEKGEEPPLINLEFLTSGIKNLSIPKHFKEKANHLLRALYDKGGKNYKAFQMHSRIDYPLCYCDNEDEFDRVMKFLYDNSFLTYNSEAGFGRRDVESYIDVRLTLEGISEVEKGLPQVPMIGLVSQTIATGDTAVDDQINHAKTLFFTEPQSMEKMRSACEALSYVLEPLRKEAKNYFASRDIEDFFQIVNNFDVRHNKDTTKNIEYPEQLEWIFYSLLNTINTYTKLKRRI